MTQMTLQLSGESERLGTGRDIYRVLTGESLYDMLGCLVTGKNKRDHFLDIPRDPVSVAHVLERRMTAPEDVRKAWQTHFFPTGDGAVAGTEGDYLIVLEDLLPKELQFLHKANKEFYTPHDYGFVLPEGAWQGLKEQNHETLCLSADEVQEVQGKGYIKRDDVWAPANKTVGKICEGTDDFPGLARGIINVREYAALVSESAIPPVRSSAPFSDSMLNVYFDLRTRNQKPSMTLLLMGSMERCSSIYGNVSLNQTNYPLVGVVPRTRYATRE